MFPLILFAFLLGMKHSADADHLLALSTPVLTVDSWLGALKAAGHWALGHTVTASLLTLFLFSFKDAVLSQYLGGFELLTGALLIVIGVFAFRKKRHAHEHSHGTLIHSHPHTHSPRHSHKHLFGMGVVQGLASNEELLILLTLSLGLTSFFGVVMGTILFSLGVLTGTVIFSLTLSFSSAKGGAFFQSILLKGSGVLSIFYGAVLVVGFF